MFLYGSTLLNSFWDEKCSRQSLRGNQSTCFIFNNLFPGMVPLWANVEKYGTARQATDENIIQCMNFACCITKVTDSHLELVILLFHGNSCFTNATQYYIISKWPVLLGLYLCSFLKYAHIILTCYLLTYFHDV